MRRHAAGFSLVEIAIVLSVIAVLGTVVITGRGYLVAARHKAAVDLVLVTHKASRQFSMRHLGGLRYGGPAVIDQQHKLSIGTLHGQGFLPKKTSTPWQAKDDSADRISVTPVNSPAACLDFTCVSIAIEGIPTNECSDLEIALKPKALEVGCQDGTLTAVMR